MYAALAAVLASVSLSLLIAGAQAEVMAQVATEAAIVPAVTGERSFKWTIDPVVVEGKKLPLTNGRHGEAFRLYRWNKSAGFTPIPYQFDERDLQGRYAFTHGPDSKMYVDDGLIDANDELAFMASDSGAQIPLDQTGSGAVDATEIEIIDPVSGERGWVYLLPATFSDQVSTKDYVSINEKDLEITSQDFVFRFCKKAPISFDFLGLREEGTDPVNIVDRLKIRAWSRVLGLIKVSVNEEDLASELRGYIDGPVRVIRRSRNTYHIAIIPTLKTDLEATFYPSHFFMDLTGKMPFDADTFVSHAELRVGVDYNDNVRGATFYTGTYRKGYTFDGNPDGLPAMEELSRTPYQWGAIYGIGKEKKDGWFSRIVPGPTLPAWFHPHIEDDATRDDRPERVPGVNNIGFYSDRMKEMKEGEFTLRSYLYHIRSFNPENVVPYLNISDNPLEVKVRMLKIPAGAPLAANEVKPAAVTETAAPVKVVPAAGTGK